MTAIMEALLCSVAGMIGIFVVVGIIIGCIVLLNKGGNAADKKSAEKAIQKAQKQSQ